MNDVVAQSNQPIVNPFQRMRDSHLSAGSVAIESERAIAEAQAKMVIAKRFPRDEGACFAHAMQACQRPTLAAAAFYSYPRGGETVSGPTIRLAEELARCWGNIEYGIRELSRKDGVSEMQAFAIDLETNIHSVQNFTVRHLRDKRGGAKELTDERDIYELTANMGGRRLRARILAILPPDLKEAAIEQCKATIAGGGGVPLSDRIKKMAVAFEKLGVSSELLTKRLGHKIDTTTPEEFAELVGIYTSLKDGVTKVSDWFGDGPSDASTGEGQEATPQAGIQSVVRRQAETAAATGKAAQQEQKSQPKGESQPAKGRTDNAPPAEAGDSKDAQKNSSPATEAKASETLNPAQQNNDEGPVF